MMSYLNKKSNNYGKWIVASTVLFTTILIIQHSNLNQHNKLNLHISHLMTGEELDVIEKNFTNLPLKFWLQAKNHKIPHRMNSTCAPLPNLLELDLNDIWQAVRFSNASLQLFNAYYDPRNITTGINVRIPCLIDRNEIYFKSYCQLWFDGEPKPVITDVEEITYIWIKAWHMHSDKQYGPYLIECKIPECHRGRIPSAVSIVEHPCDKATNLLKVHYEHQDNGEKKDFAVCVKGLDLLQVDLSARLAEWMEFQFLMGADKVFIYNLHIHPNIKKLLDYYIKLGKVDLRLTTLPVGQSNFPIFQHQYIKSHVGQQYLDELIPYNDCFYRNMNLYKYIILLDIDEVIVPVLDDNWNDLINRVLNHTKPGEKFASLAARHVYFLDDMTPEGTYSNIPPYMHMLQHVYRSYNFTPPRHYVKSFFNTDYVLTFDPFKSSPQVFSHYDMDTSNAHMQHYRTECHGEVDCNVYKNRILKDTVIWKFKDVLIERTNKVLEECGLLV